MVSLEPPYSSIRERLKLSLSELSTQAWIGATQRGLLYCLVVVSVSASVVDLLFSEYQNSGLPLGVGEAMPNTLFTVTAVAGLAALAFVLGVVLERRGAARVYSQNGVTFVPSLAMPLATEQDVVLACCAVLQIAPALLQKRHYRRIRLASLYGTVAFLAAMIPSLLSPLGLPFSLLVGITVWLYFRHEAIEEHNREEDSSRERQAELSSRLDRLLEGF